MPLEVQLPPLQMVVHEEFTSNEKIQLHFQELDEFKENHLGVVNM